MTWTDKDAQAKAGEIMRVTRTRGEAAALELIAALTPGQRAHVAQVTGEELARRAVRRGGRENPR